MESEGGRKRGRKVRYIDKLRIVSKEMQGAYDMAGKWGEARRTSEEWMRVRREEKNGST